MLLGSAILHIFFFIQAKLSKKVFYKNKKVNPLLDSLSLKVSYTITK